MLHTPGHTPESISVVVYDGSSPAPYGVLTGDTLFIGDVGRPDLLSSKGVTSEDLAGQLYDSLHDKLLTLPDTTRVYPAHGAGSACGKNLSTETWSTIGDQRRTNYACSRWRRRRSSPSSRTGRPRRRLLLVRRRAQPRAHAILDETSRPPALSLAEVVRRQRAGAVVLDTRDPIEFATGHLVGSINVGLGGRYAEYAGGVIQPGAPIVLVTDPRPRGRGQEPARPHRFRPCGRVPADPLEALKEHPDDVTRSSRLTVRQLELGRANGELADLQLVDVRQPGETAHGMIPGAIPIPLTLLNERLPGSTPPSRPSSTAPAATAPRSPPAGWPPPDSPTCPTCSAATRPGHSCRRPRDQEAVTGGGRAVHRAPAGRTGTPK